MFPYWLLFSVFAAGSVSRSLTSRPNVGGSALLSIAALLLMLMIGLRHETGGDWFAYLRIFQGTYYRTFDEILAQGDPGYLVINWIAQRLDLEVWFVNLICAGIFASGLVAFARQQPNPWLTILVAVPYLIIVVAMGYTRQGVAIGLLMGGLAALGKGSLFRFFIYALIAVTFHKSAIVALPLIGLAISRNKLLTYGLMALFLPILYFVFIDNQLDELMTNYVEQGLTSQGTAVRVVLNVIPAIIFLLYSRRLTRTDLERRLWRNFSIAAVLCIIALVWSDATTVIDRLALYLIPLQLVVLARLPYAFLDRGRPNLSIAIGVILYSAAIQFVWLTQAYHADAWLPYMLTPLEGR